MTRKEQLEEAAAALHYHPGPGLKHFLIGAQYSDQNPSPEILEAYNKLYTKLDLCVKALNKIGMAQMGALDYTQDFFELTKNIVRETLKEIK